MRDEKEMGNKKVDICSSLNIKCRAMRGQRQEFSGTQGIVNDKLLPCCPPLLLNGVINYLDLPQVQDGPLKGHREREECKRHMKSFKCLFRVIKTGVLNSFT